MPHVGRRRRHACLPRLNGANCGRARWPRWLQHGVAMGHYELLETVAIADCALQVEGTDLDDLFATAARAVAELMVDPATITPSLERSVSLDAPSLDLLFFDWLNELIALKDTEGAAFPEVEAHVEGNGPWCLRARLVGGLLQGGPAALRADPKAVTFHLFRVEPWSGGWRARVVIDT